jgi:hypothetical protein
MFRPKKKVRFFPAKNPVDDSWEVVALSLPPPHCRHLRRRACPLLSPLSLRSLAPAPYAAVAFVYIVIVVVALLPFPSPL